MIGASATGSGEEFAHPFQLGGDTLKAERTVELTVTDDEGSVDTETRTVRVVRPERTYYVTDHLGSVRVVMDDSANVEETRDSYTDGCRCRACPGAQRGRVPRKPRRTLPGT